MRRWRVVVVLAVATGLVGAASSVAGSASPPATASQVKALVAASVHITKLSAAESASLTTIANENADKFYDIGYACLTATACDYGDLSSPTTVVLYGDSHVRMWLPALLPLAATDHFRIDVFGRDACPVVSLSLTGTFSVCQSINQQVITAIVALKPAAIIVADRTTWLKSVSSASWEKGFRATLTDLAASKAAIAVIGDIQIFNDAVVTCLAQHPTSVQTCSVKNPNTQQPNHFAAEKAAASAAKVTYVNPTPWLCASKCSPVIGSYVAYWDAFHITVAYAGYLTGVLGAALAHTLRSATS